jgi:DNA-binding transcriptional LysR family regulator
MLNLNELVVFLTAAETGNYSEAGRRLRLSQPAVSQTMDSLEKRFGAKLFTRQGRSVRLTEAGQLLKPLARELLSAANRLEDTMSSLNGEVVGEINLGCCTSAGKYLLPGLIARFRRKFPQVHVNLWISSCEAVLNKLLLGEISLGVSSKKIEHRDLEYQEFFKDEIVLIVPCDHRWAHFRMIYPNDLQDESLILREDGAGSREVLMQGLGKHDISPDMVNVSMILGNAEAITMAVEEGIGAAFVSKLVAARSLEYGRVVEVKVKGMNLARSLYLVRSRRIPAARSQSEFWSFVQSSEAELNALCTISSLP